MASDTSVRMLSPPLSPYPDLSGFSGSFKLRAIERECSSSSGSPSRPCSSQLSTKLSRADDGRHALVQEQDASRTLATPAPSTCETPEIEPRKRKMVTCWDTILASPAKFFKRERSFLELYPIHRPNWSNYMYVESAAETRVRRRPRPRVRRIVSEMESASSSESVPLRSRASSVVPERTSSGNASSDEEFGTRARAAPRKRSSVASPSRVHDMGYDQIEDYAPSVETLPAGRSLRAEWKGAPMDLSQDPDVHLLHPAEVHLASVLRLPAEVYLDSKRRLFAEKVHRLRQSLPFRRTDSQKACRIDVNKASRLFGAFEKVGWLEDDLFHKYL